MARPALKQEPANQQPQLPAVSAAVMPQFTMPGVMSLNTRVSAEISTALLTASMQRKIMRQPPFTQQDIVAEALTDWLKKNGYMN